MCVGGSAGDWVGLVYTGRYWEVKGEGLSVRRRVCRVTGLDWEALREHVGVRRRIWGLLVWTGRHWWRARVCVGASWRLLV